MNIKGRTTEDERVGQFSIEGQPLSVRLLVPVTQSVYNDLVFLAQRTEGATREADEEVGAALVAASLLLRDCAVLHTPPKTPPPPNPHRPQRSPLDTEGALACLMSAAMPSGARNAS